MGRKPPGFQTAVDLCILDIIKFRLFALLYLTLILDLGLFHGQLELEISEILWKIYFFTGLFHITTTQIILSIKATLIFKGEWINELSDRATTRIFRFSSMLYAFIVITFDERPGQDPIYPKILQLLTGLEQPPP